MNKIELFLSSMELSDKEIALYLNGLKLGPTKASFLSRKTGFTRQHTYDLLKSLEQKGLVSKQGKEYGQKFIMEDPRNLRGVIERKKQKIDKLEENLQVIMPELESFYAKKGIVPKIKFFEEIEGIKEIFENLLNCSSKQYSYIGSTKELVEVLGEEYLNGWIKRRIKKGISSRTVRIKQKEISTELYTGEEEFLREVKYAPEKVDIKQTVMMYDNKVAIISSKNECVGFLIESEEYSNTMNALFELLWNGSSKS
jgi:HTH-type transcriptional regulator, sugar sensing transcriptional regulator